ncbi:MAG: general secretion pathway protein GspB [Sulfuritalea sp.]|jgi:general secretion pathway protein B|nr:general secretion pathway protein GspB [Sulfuritalea sp.]
MSYILEALEKSDQLRQKGATPTLMSIPLPLEETRQRTFPWLLALTAIVFIAGLLIGWLQPWQSGHPAATVVPTEGEAVTNVPAALTAKNAPVEPVAASSRTAGQVPVPKTLSASVPSPVALPALRQVPPKVASSAISPALAVKTPAVAVREPESAAPAKPAAATEQNVIAKSELPPAILQELPAMSVSLHAYSAKASNRLVSVNNKFLQEGEALIPGLILEQVTPKDMIFSYKGFRFRQGVQ